MEDFVGTNEQITHYDPVAEQEAQDANRDNQSQVESEKDRNFRNLREQAEASKQRAEVAERRAQELEFYLKQNMNQNKPAVKMEYEEEDDFDISDDSYIEGHQFKKYVKNLKNEFKKTTAELQKMNQKSVADQAEIKLKSEFPDIQQVVTRENLDRLAQMKPALYRSIMACTDLYDQGYTAYEMIRSAGIVKEYNTIDRKLEDNRTKPRSAANASSQVADTPLSRLGDYDRRILSDTDRDMINKRVAEAKSYR